MITLKNTDVLDGLRELESNSVDMLITSPPYNLEIEYSSTVDNLPYNDYLSWVSSWLIETYRVLKSGGRIAINIPIETNLGGKKFISSDYISILESIGYLRAAYIIWDKRNVTRRTAWGSWLSPSFPVVNNPLECILVYSKESLRHPGDKNLSDISRDEFISYTMGVWDFQPEHKTKIGHPAPFPEELPYRLIKLYTYMGDVILDPFVGSGTTAVVCKKTFREFIGFDISPDYIKLALDRLERV